MASQVRDRNRFWYLLAIVATIALGLISRRFPAIVPSFLGKYPGDALWALMVFWGWAFVFPKAASVRIAALALSFSFAVEFLKFCQISWLVEVRQSTWGHLVLGQVFSWQNLVAYTVGVIFGVLAERQFLRGRGVP